MTGVTGLASNALSFDPAHFASLVKARLNIDFVIYTARPRALRS